MLALAAIGFALPIVAYWLAIGRAPGVSPAEARRRVAEPGTNVVLVDIRSPESRAQARVGGAVDVPWSALQRAKSAEDLPEPLRGRPLLLLCSSGILAADAALHLRSIGVSDVRKVDDGLAGWIAAEAGASGAAPALCRVICPPDGTYRASRESPAHEQWAAVLTGFGVKPAYMILSLILIAVLWRQAAPDLAALRRSMAAFLVGEAFCMLNYFAFRDASHLSEFLHSYGMVAAFGLAAYALFAGLDRRVLHFTDPGRRCAAGSLCEACVKQGDASCGLKRVFLLAVPSVAALGLMPVCADPQMVSYNTTILGAPYNWSHPVIYQIFESRVCPAYGLILMAIALGMLLRPGLNGMAAAKAFFAAGLGPLGFGFFRFVLFGCYRDNLVWFAFWEEIAEFLFVVGAAFVLWVFRRRLFREGTQEA
jgi:rhodanese-related sulfurtransferase